MGTVENIKEQVKALSLDNLAQFRDWFLAYDANIGDAQLEELDRRLDDLEREGPVGASWDEAIDRIRRRER